MIRRVTFTFAVLAVSSLVLFGGVHGGPGQKVEKEAAVATLSEHQALEIFEGMFGKEKLFFDCPVENRKTNNLDQFLKGLRKLTENPENTNTVEIRYYLGTNLEKLLTLGETCGTKWFLNSREIANWFFDLKRMVADLDKIRDSKKKPGKGEKIALMILEVFGENTENLKAALDAKDFKGIGRWLMSKFVEIETDEMTGSRLNADSEEKYRDRMDQVEAQRKKIERKKAMRDEL